MSVTVTAFFHRIFNRSDPKITSMSIKIYLGLLCVLMFLQSAIGTGLAQSNISQRAILMETEPNDNFTTANVLLPGDEVNGTTGMLSPHPIDVFKVKMQSGKILSVSVHSNSTGYNDLVLRLEVYDKWAQNPVAYSHSGFPWESTTFLAFYDDWYYIMLIPWKGNSISYTLHVNSTTAPEVFDKTSLLGELSNCTDHPADWYSIFLNGGQTSNDVGNATLSFDTQSVHFDLYFRDLVTNSWSWRYNFSWWGDTYGGSGGKVQEVENAASYTGTYYWDVQAWTGTGPYSLTVRKKSAPSDGDNTPSAATIITRKPGEAKASYIGTVDMAYDHYDFYKVHLKTGQSLNASLTMLEPWTFAIYRITIISWNVTGNRWDPLSSWTNIKDPNIVTGQAQAFLNPAPKEDDYYIQIMAQVPLHPSNHSNLADWHVNKAVGKYQLVVDLPKNVLHAPIIKPDAPTQVRVIEDTPNSDLKLSSVFTDQDIGDPDLQDALSYSTAGAYDHLRIKISNDSNGTVTITPETDWNGQQDVTFVATDLYGLQNSTKITVRVEVANDRPKLAPSIAELLHDFTVKEGTVNQSNNNAVLVDKNSDPWTYKGFTDPDLLYGDLLTFSVVSNSSANAYVPTEISEQNNYITVKYQGAKVSLPTGDTSKYVVPITIRATDLAGESVSYTYNVTVEQNPPEITCTDTVVDFGEGNIAVINLNNICKAATGHKLTFEFLGGNSQNMTVKVDAQGNAKFTAIGDYYNNDENLNFKAYMTEPWQKTVYFSLNVVIHNMIEPPTIYNPQPDPAIAINIPEGGNEDFSASIKDFDNSPLDMRYTWYVDYIAASSGANTFRFSPDYNAAEVNSGKHTIEIVVRDGTGGEVHFNWSVNVDNTNRKPTARITTPQNNTQVDPGKLTYLIAEANDPDGDPMELKWYENGVLIHQNHFNNGSGLDYWSKRFKPGSTHCIVLKVNDTGGLSSTYYRTIVVDKETPPPPFYYRLCGDTCIIFLSISASIVAIIKKGRIHPYLRP